MTEEVAAASHRRILSSWRLCLPFPQLRQASQVPGTLASDANTEVTPSKSSYHRRRSTI
jgi:hypothetical protein